MDPAILRLDARRAHMVRDGLRLYVAGLDAEHPQDAEVADGLLREVDALLELLRVHAHQHVRALGLGRSKGRPQG